MNKKLGLIIFSLLSLIAFSVGMVVSYNTVFNKKNGKNKMQNDNFIQYDVSNPINITNTYPMNDEIANISYQQEYQEMVISIRKNSNIEDLEYYVVLEDIKNGDNLLNSLVYSISLDGINYSESQMLDYDAKNKIIIIYRGKIKSNVTNTLEENIHLRIWMKEDNTNQSSLQNKSFNALVNVYYNLK